MATKTELLEQAEIIRTQTEENANTANLVGGLLKGIIEYTTDAVDEMKEASTFDSGEKVSETLVENSLTKESERLPTSGAVLRTIDERLDDIATTESEILDLTSLSSCGGYLNAQGLLTPSEQTYGVVVELQNTNIEGNLKVVFSNNSKKLIRYAFLTAVPQVGQTTAFCNGCSLVSVTARREETDIPLDCNAIYIFAQDGQNRLPDSATLLYQTFMLELNAMVKAVAEQNNQLRKLAGNATLPGMDEVLTTTNSFREVWGYLKASGKFIAHPDKHGAYIPVTSYVGKVVEFVQATYGKVQYAFVKSDPVKDTDNSILCNGCALTTVSYGSITEPLIPVDCAYIYILLKNGSVNTAPAAVKIKSSSTMTDLIANLAPRMTLTEQNITRLSSQVESHSTLANTIDGIKVCAAQIRGKIGIIGDSISTFEGYLPEGFLSFYPKEDREVLSVHDTWWDIFASAAGCDVQNLSWSGSRVTDTNPDKLDFYARTNMLDDPDFIFVELGCNDLLNNVEVGTSYDFDADISDLSESLFIPAYIKGIKALMENYPNAKIYILIMPMAVEYSEPIRHIATHFSIPVIETGDYYWSRTNGDTNVHPTASEMKEIANVVSGFLSTRLKIDNYAKKGLSKLPVAEKDNLINNIGLVANHETVEVIDLNSMPLRDCTLGSSSWYKITDDKWHRNGGGQCHIAVPVLPGETYRIENISEKNGFFGFLTDAYTGNYSNGNAIPFITGYQRLSIRKMSSRYITIPPGCAFLCLVIVDGAANLITYNLSKVSLRSTPLETKSIIDLDMVTEEQGVVTTSAEDLGSWYKKNNKYLHKIIPVVPGQMYRIHASYHSNSYYSLAKSYDSAGIVRSSYDAFRHTILRFGVETITIFEDVNYLVVSTKSNDLDVTPYKVELVGFPSSDSVRETDKEILIGASSLETGDSEKIGVFYDADTNKACIRGSSETGPIRAGFNCSSLVNGQSYHLKFKVKNTNVNDVNLSQLSSLNGGNAARIITIPKKKTIKYDARYVHNSAYPYIGVLKGHMIDGVCLSFEYFEILPYENGYAEIDEIPFKFRHAHWNVGHFSYYDGAQGTYRTTITPEQSEEMAMRFRNVLNRISADTFGVSEYNDTFDTGGTLTKNVLFQNYTYQYEGVRPSAKDYNVNSLFFRGNFHIVGGWTTYFNEFIQNRYYRVILVRIQGRIVHFVQTHTDFADADVRLAQVQQLIDFFADMDYVVMSADWNAPMDLYSIFVNAGYTISNCGYIGDYATVRSGISDPAVGRIDNIICKGFDMSNIQVYSDTMSELGVPGGLSDHAAISCDLSLIL